MNILLALFVALIATLPIHYERDVTATKLYEDYKKDKAKADKLYLDKPLFLHGIVKQQSSNVCTVWLVIPEPPGGDGLPASIDDHALTSIPIYKPGDKFDLVCIGAGVVFNVPLVLHCKPIN